MCTVCSWRFHSYLPRNSSPQNVQKIFKPVLCRLGDSLHVRAANLRRPRREALLVDECTLAIVRKLLVDWPLAHVAKVLPDTLVPTELLPECTELARLVFGTFSGGWSVFEGCELREARSITLRATASSSSLLAKYLLMLTELSLFRSLCSKALSRDSRLDRVNFGIGLFVVEALGALMSAS